MGGNGADERKVVAGGGKADEQLFDAIAKDQLGAVQKLLAGGASPLWKNPANNERTALDKALEMENPRATRMLLEHLKLADAAVSAVLRKLCGAQNEAEVIRGKGGEGAAAAASASSQASAGAKKSKEAAKRARLQRVEEAIAATKRGEFVVVLDNEDRENEGDLIIAAEKITVEKMAWMVKMTSGVICVSLREGRLKELELPQMVQNNTESHGTAFTVSVDYKHGTSTGISASDRTATLLALAGAVGRDVKPDDFSRPGHIFPLRYREGGVTVRAGHTEASLDLARLAGLYPAGVMCELTNDDGSMMRAPALRRFAKENNLAVVTIEEMIEFIKEKGE